VLVYWGLVSLPHILSLGQDQRSVSQLSAVNALCWFAVFQFAALFDFGHWSLAQEMSFVDHYLPYFRQWLITHPLLALLSFQFLFTECSHRA
jgi:hypothetical protein